MAAEIIGRRDELRVLDAFVESAAGGGQALLLEGDAGIGKTILWEKALRGAGVRDFRVLRSRPTQSEAQVAFAAVGDLLVPAVSSGVLERLAPVQRRALETALLIREPDDVLPDTRVLALALLSTVRALTEERPVLIALDDAQWLDASSADVLTFMLRRLDAEPVAVLATVRGRPVGVPLDLDRTFAAFRRLPIEPLSVGAIHRLLWGRFGIAVPRPVIMRVHRISGGNPFFALELGRALVDGSIRAGDTDVELPESLRAIVAHRLGALPARVRETLAAVAALAAPSMAVLEALGGTGVRDIELAQHLAIAASGPDEQVAAALDAAAGHAHARGAAQAAADLAERAIALTPADALESINRRRIGAAEHCRYAGDTRKAAVLLEEAVAASQPGRVRAEALSRLAGPRGMSEGFPVAVELLRRALAEPGLEPSQEVNILCELVWLAQQGGDNRQGARYAAAGLALAEQLADPATLALALAASAQITFARTGAIRRDLLDRALELEQTLDGDGYTAAGWWTWHAGLPMRLSPSRVTLALLLGRSDRHDESRALWRALIAEATQRADPDVVRCLFHCAQMEMTAGAWEAAAQLCEDAIQLTRQIGLEMFEPLCLSILAEIDAYRGETERARRSIPELLRICETARFRWAAVRLRIALAVLGLSHDDAAASWQQATPLLRDVEELDVYHARLAGSAGIEALLAIGDLPRAERLLAQIDRRAADADTALRPLVHRCRGALLASKGDWEPAIASLEAATVAPEPPQAVNPFEHARSLLALGTVQRRAQHKRAARESLQRAAEIFERLGARVWLAKARSELRHIGGRTASDAQLSETERRIVELVVAGRQNSEVAATLNLSPNTVAWNLSKIYRKLGVRSRTELAAHLASNPHR